MRPSMAAGWPAVRSVTLFSLDSPMPKPGLPVSRTTNVISVGLCSTGRCTTNVCRSTARLMAFAMVFLPQRTSVPSATKLKYLQRLVAAQYLMPERRGVLVGREGDALVERAEGAS